MIDGLRPYPAMKDSGVPWLGRVPNQWEILPASAVYRARLVKNTGLVEKTVLSLSYGRIVVKPPARLRGLVPESFESYQIVDPGNIIVRTTDLQNDQTSLRVGHARHRGIITAAYMCLETTAVVSKDFGYQQLNAYDLLKIIYGYGSGLRQSLDFSDIKRMPVLVPPPEEQAAVVRFLDHADRRIRRYIRAKQELIKLLEEEKQAIIHRAVTRGLDPNVRLKPSGVEWLGDVPGHWEVVPLKRAFSRMDYGISDSGSATGVIPVLTMGHIRNGVVTVPERGGVDRVAPDLLLKHKDLLFNRTNSAELVAKVGLFCAVGRPVTFASYLVRLRSSATNSPEFLNLALNAPAFLGAARREAIPSLHQANLNPSRYGRLPIPLPPRQEQERIFEAVREQTSDLNDASASRLLKNPWSPTSP